MKKPIAMVLALAMILSGCGTASASTDLMAGYVPQQVPDKVLMPQTHPANFAVSLFQASAAEGENSLVSPLSVLTALAMTANGAEGETLTQMEQTMGASRAQLNSWLHSYLSEQKEAEALHLANAIWFNSKEALQVEPDFLQTNADYFGAGTQSAPFDDSTCREINRWVEDNTGGMIENILDRIPQDAVMYLVNALAFEAKWERVYTADQVRDAVFTTEDGREQKVEMMYDTGSRYLETDNATGFLRYYEGGRYAFAALLPEAGTTVSELVASLDGDTLTAMLAAPEKIPVDTGIPKFEAGSTLELGEILRSMGMANAFDPLAADFSAMGTSTDGNIHISRVLHKTFISVGEQGTRAGAATVVENSDSARAVVDTAAVILDRPFVYMLVDCEAGLPFFLGTCMEMGNNT